MAAERGFLFSQQAPGLFSYGSVKDTAHHFA
jgi:hypothetical protein